MLSFTVHLLNLEIAAEKTITTQVHLLISMATEPTQPADEDCVLESKTPENIRKWTLSWEFVTHKKNFIF